MHNNNDNTQQLLNSYKEATQLVDTDFQQELKNRVVDAYSTYYKPNMKKNMFTALNQALAWKVSIAVFGIIAFLSPMVYLEFIETEDSVDTPTIVATQKAKVNLVEGELLVNDSLVQEGAEIEVNSTIETQENTFASLRLEDGSYFRLNENTQVTVSELTEGNYTFELETGEVYARVTESEEREYAVVAGENTFTALGTAYSVEQGENTKVVVFESEVEAIGEEVNKTVNEGQELTIGKEVTELIIDELDQEFIERNKMLDEEEFPNNLGVLETLVFGAEETEEEIVEEEEGQAEQQQTGNNNNGGGQAQAPAPAPQPAPAPAPSFPTGPAPFLSGFFQEAYQGFDAFLLQKEANQAVCGTSYASFVLADGTSITMLSCGTDPLTGRSLRAQKVNGGTLGVTIKYKTGEGEQHPAYPSDYRLIPAYHVNNKTYQPGTIPGQTDKYGADGDFNTPHITPNGIRIHLAADELIDDMYAAGVLD